MISICYNCGSLKEDPVLPCAACHSGPRTDKTIALSVFLSDRFLDGAKLDEASRLIRSGKSVTIPPALETRILDALRGKGSASSPGSVWGKVKAGLLIGAVVLLFILFNSWPQFKWASFKDSEESYEHYLSRFPHSEYSEQAGERLHTLREKREWHRADGSEQVEILRSFVDAYPVGRYTDEARRQVTAVADLRWSKMIPTGSKSEILRFLEEYPETSKKDAAKARIIELSERKWLAISQTRSAKEIFAYLEEFPESPKATQARTRLQELSDDYDWVTEQDSLNYYRTFVNRHPTHPRIAAMEKRIIDLEVQEIAAGNHGEMPKAQALSYGGTTTNVEVENKTGYELTVRYSGPDTKKLVVSVGETRTITLSPGEYRVAASVNAVHVTNYFGTDKMTLGRYSSSFYIKTKSGGSSSFPGD